MKLTSALILLCLLPGISAAAQLPGSDLSFSSSLGNPAQGGEGDVSSSDSGAVRPIPVPRSKKQSETIDGRPFSAIAVGVKVDTQGIGIELATPLSRSFNLRSGINAFTFSYPFGIDGVNYDARLHLRSAQTSLDWFPWHRRFHISPGLMYFKDAFSAPSSVPPGQYFELGDNGFVNSVDDPVAGSATLVFPRTVAPMLTIGVGNLIPRSGSHISIPFEIGAAYTGAAKINVTLNGTACNNQGCFTFANNADAQSSLQQEIQKINADLKKVPVYPILSIGFGYRF